MVHVLSRGYSAIAILFLWKNSGILEVSEVYYYGAWHDEPTHWHWMQRLSVPTFPEMLNNGAIFVLMVWFR